MIDKITELLKTGRQSKRNLQQVFELTDRGVRLMVAEIARTEPVVSLSLVGGYKIANGADDVEDVKRQIRENESRAKKIIIRNEALEEFLEQMGGTKE